MPVRNKTRKGKGKKPSVRDRKLGPIRRNQYPSGGEGHGRSKASTTDHLLYMLAQKAYSNENLMQDELKHHRKRQKERDEEVDTSLQNTQTEYDSLKAQLESQNSKISLRPSRGEMQKLIKDTSERDRSFANTLNERMPGPPLASNRELRKSTTDQRMPTMSERRTSTSKESKEEA